MNALVKIAILGLYNSRSTALAGALHRLGVHMGAPFWYSSDECAKNNFYEPWDLACLLRFWWNEPDIRENTPPHIRIACLASWVRLRQCAYPTAVGAKHPLLCLCGDDLVTAWGADTIFLRTYRPLEESIEWLRARHWFAQREESLQRRLWQALDDFCARQPHLSIEYRRLRSDTVAVLREIADYAHLTPTALNGRPRRRLSIVPDKMATVHFSWQGLMHTAMMSSSLSLVRNSVTMGRNLPQQVS
jgi:hypothetical protein